MKPREPLLSVAAEGEVSALIATLHRTEQRLEELTAGEVDTVADRDGRTLLLRRSQEQLRHSEAARQAAVLDALPAQIALLDRQGLIVSVNQAWRRSGGASALGPGHAIGINYPGICAAAQGEGAASALQAAEGIRSILAGTMPSFSFEYPCHSPAEQRWCMLTVTPLGDARPNGAVVMHQDVTERKRAEEEQRTVRQLLDNIVENIPSAVQLKSVQHDMRIQMWNKAAEAMYGLPSEAAIGRTVHDLWPKADADRMHAADLALAASGEMQDFPDRPAQTRNRGQIRVHMRKVALSDADGKATHLLVVADDMTAQLADQARLRDSEARFRSLTALSSDWFWEQDEAYRFVKFSGGDRVGGWGPDQDKAIGVTRWDLPTIEPLSQSWDQHKAVLGARKPFRNFEYRRVLASGVMQYVAASGEPIFDAGGRFTGYRGVATDITARKLDEIRIKRLSRVHAVLSAINALIVRVRDHDELFREACRMAIEAGGFRMAWIGLVDKAAGIVKPVATAGDVRDFFATAPLAITDARPGGHGGTGLAIREMKPVISNDVHNDPQRMMKPELLERGVNSLAIIPLLVGGEAIGVLALYSTELGFFDDEEMRLLLELAGDIAFALEHVEKAEKLARMTRVNAVLSGINGAIVRIRDRRELFEEACRIAVEVGSLPFVSMSVVDETGMRLRPAASAGDDGGFLATLHDRLSLRDDSPAGHGISARSVRQKRALVLNDVENAPEIANKKALASRSIRSMAAFPLLVAGRAVGAFALHSTEVGFFDDEEMKLLQEVAGNIAFALEHMEKEEKVERLTRVYAVLSGINTLIVRVHDRDELFEQACRIAVEQGGFRMAWIGIVDRAAQKIIPVASAGANAGFLADPRQWLSLTDDSPGPAVMAVRDKQPVVVDEVASDARMHGRMAHLDPGVRSLVILPLLVAGEPVAVFGLHALNAGYFDEKEMTLLRELGGDIAFAIDHIGKQERLDYLAYYDALTGLANRSLFLERTSQYMRSATRDGHQLALFLIDLQRFKNINDSLGQAAGDELLKQVAQWLSHEVADVNLLARIDADHFAVVLPVVKQDGSVARLLDKAMDAFEEHPFHLEGGVFRVAAKSGVALFPGDGASADALFKNAEAALKKAKASGDRYLFYTQQMTEAVAGKLTLENQLREALDKGQFVLHYQPKVSLITGKLTGAEALIRWNDPRTGLVPPGRFIPVLEETGMIGEVGRWALRQAVEDYLRWLDAGLPAMRIAVNVSPLQLRHRDFTAEVAQAIAIDARAPAGLELEITENLIMEDVKHSIATLRAIRALGVTIAIDDFGTGFSSLSYLSKLPVDTLKIDRSFVVEMTAPEARSLVPAIIGLAHSLSLKVVAEGVETEDQSRLLRLLNCDEMQGYLFSKPVPGEVFEARFLAQPAAAGIAAAAIV